MHLLAVTGAQTGEGFAALEVAAQWVFGLLGGWGILEMFALCAAILLSMWLFHLITTRF